MRSTAMETDGLRSPNDSSSQAHLGPANLHKQPDRGDIGPQLQAQPKSPPIALCLETRKLPDAVSVEGKWCTCGVMFEPVMPSFSRAVRLGA